MLSCLCLLETMPLRKRQFTNGLVIWHGKVAVGHTGLCNRRCLPICCLGPELQFGVSVQLRQISRLWARLARHNRRQPAPRWAGWAA